MGTKPVMRAHLCKGNIGKLTYKLSTLLLLQKLRDAYNIIQKNTFQPGVAGFQHDCFKGSHNSPSDVVDVEKSGLPGV